MFYGSKAKENWMRTKINKKRINNKKTVERLKSTGWIFGGICQRKTQITNRSNNKNSTFENIIYINLDISFSAVTAPSSPLSPPVSPTVPALELPPAGKNGECTICFDQEVDTVIYTCGHMCLCNDCGLKLKRQINACCPICRRPIKDVIKTYRPWGAGLRPHVLRLPRGGFFRLRMGFDMTIYLEMSQTRTWWCLFFFFFS